MSSVFFDVTAARKPTNLSVNSDLLRRAREESINVSALLEAALIEELRRRQRTAWVEANRDAIEHSNQAVREGGLFSDGLRTV